MSTRAMYSFIEGTEVYHVYKHHDGYPTGAAQWLTAAIPFAWAAPRYEASDFAAAFVAANKLPTWLQTPIVDHLDKLRSSRRPSGFADKSMTLKVAVPNYAFGGDSISRGGGVYLMPSGSVYDVAHGDLEYRYDVYQGNDQSLRVRGYAVDFWGGAAADKESLIIDCPLADIEAKAAEYEQAKVQAA